MSEKLPDINDPKQWGPPVYSKKETFKTGEIFIVDIYGDGRERFVYRARGNWSPANGNDYLSLEQLKAGQWRLGHSWTMNYAFTKVQRYIPKQDSVTRMNAADDRVFGKDLSDWRVWANNKPGECPCGILRSSGLCKYH